MCKHWWIEQFFWFLFPVNDLVISLLNYQQCHMTSEAETVWYCWPAETFQMSFTPLNMEKRIQQGWVLVAWDYLWNHNGGEPPSWHHQSGSTWETEIIFTLYSPLTGLIIAGDRCAQGLESIIIHPWTMINDPVRTNSKWSLSNSICKLICHQTQE